MKKNDNTTATEKPAKKLTAEQKAKAKEKLAKKRAALKEKKRLAREKKAARLAKKRAAKKAVREAKKAKKLARLEKKRARILKAKELKRARLEKKRAKLAAQKAKAKELKAKGKQKAKAEKPAKVTVEKADLKNVPTKDMAKELTKRLKTFAKVLADRKNDAAEREELEKRIEKDGIQVSVLDGVLVARLFITAEARVAELKQPAVKCAAIAAEQPKENVQPEATAKEPPVEAEATEVPIGDTYGSEPTDEELAQIEAEQDAEAADGDKAEDDEEEEEIDPRSDVNDDQADFRREFFGNAENTEDFE